jgi:uncharacterized membrane protein YheB (UPF0754 family)
VVTLVGVAVHKLNKLSKKFDKSVSELEDSTVKDIQQTVVQKAVENAAQNTVKDYMRDMHNVVLSDANRELRKEAQEAVSEAKKDIHAKVQEVTAEEASKIDMIEFRKAVRDKAEQKVLAKFDDDLQDVLDRYNSSLGQVTKVYTNIADTIRKVADKGDDGKVRFTLG